MRLQRAVLGELVLNFFAASGVLLFVAGLGVAVSAMYRDSQIPLTLLLGGLPYFLVGLLPHFLPMSFLVAVLLTYGRMAADAEIVAIRSAGVHLGRILVPAVGVACGIAVLNHRLLDEGIPTLRFRGEAYLRRAFEETVEQWNQGVPDLHFGPFYMRGTPTDRPGVRRDVVIFYETGGDEGGRRDPESSPEAFRLRVQADEARFEVDGDLLRIHLVRPRFLGAGDGRRPPTAFRMAQGAATLELSLESLRGKPWVAKERDLSTAELLASLIRGRSHRVDPEEYRLRARFEVERRSALAFAPVVFIFLGAPLAVFFRRGSRLFSFFLAFAVVLAGYYPLLLLGEHLALAEILPTLPAAALGDVVLLAVGGGLTARMLRR